MKKFLLALFVAFGCGSIVSAQTNRIATLKHGEYMSHYYGLDALTDAYNAAQAGDVITLSPGTFTWPNIYSYNFEKSITVRGAGFDNPEGNTYISGEISICLSGNEAVATWEGVIFNTRVNIQRKANAEEQGTLNFIKCDFTGSDYGLRLNLEYNNLKKAPKVRLYNCIVRNTCYFEYGSCPDFVAYNSYVKTPKCNSSISLAPAAIASFVNCVIEFNKDAQYACGFNLYNSICNWVGDYAGDDWNCILPSTTTSENCLSINKSALFNYTATNINNKYADSVSDVFKTYTGNLSIWSVITEKFELTDEAKATYLGTDGTEIGMYGGMYPYTTNLQYPIVSKFNVEPRTTKEGKLTVEIEVDGK